MKRKMTGLFAAMMTAAALLAGTAATCTAAETEPKVWDIPKAGLEITLPEKWVEDGIAATYSASVCSSELILTSVSVFNATVNDMETGYEELGDTEEYMDFYNARCYTADYYVSAKDELGKEEDIVEALFGASAAETDVSLDELAKADGWTLYELSCDELYQRPEPLEGTEERLENILAEIPKMRENIVFREPEGLKALDEGNVISFETEDFDGNPVNSEELFARNKYTLVNLWMSWCHYCVEEMPELEEMSKEFAADQGGVIAIMLDSNEEDKLATGKSLVEEAGTTYPMLKASDEMRELLDTSSYPVTFFADSEGAVVGEPIYGMAPDLYRARMKELLSPESAAEAPESGAEAVETEASAAEEAAAETAGEYKVVVYDEDRNPLADVYVQFCSDNACKYEVTDENGTAVFNEPAGTYTIHVADVPEGFEETDEEFEAPETPGTVEITLKKG